MNSFSNNPPHRILIASANPLFSQGLRKIFTGRWPTVPPEMHLASSMEETLRELENWLPELVVVDYDDRAINRAEFLSHFVSGVSPMQVMLVSLQASGEVVVYDRRTLTPDQARDWISQGEPSAESELLISQPVQQALSSQRPRRSFFTWRWMLATLLVIAAVGVFIRLGIWQLDRLAQRRAYNAQMSAQMSQAPLNLNQELPVDRLAGMEYRPVVVTGQYQYDGEMIVRNQVWENQLGVHILTPLKIQDEAVSVLVDRGWIPFEESSQERRAQFAETGNVTVSGIIRSGSDRPPVAPIQPTLAPGQAHHDTWNYLDLTAIQQESSSNMLPVYIQQGPDAAQTGLPFRVLPVVELTDGSHLGYALQWFAFAIILGLGYPFYVRRQLAGADVQTSGAENAAPVMTPKNEQHRG